VLAASVMTEIRTALRAYMLQGHELTEVISLLNELLVSTGRSRGATLSIFDLDPEAEQLEAVTAGHLPPLMIEADGNTHLLKQKHGLPVGVRTGSDYQACRHPFPTGSRLLLYTDGLIERRGESLDEGFRRLAVAARDAARHTDSSLADRVYRALVDENPLEDDIAILAIETMPLEATLELTLPARPHVLRGLRNTLGRWLRAAGADEGELFDITLSTSEAATNAIEHAYGALEANFRVCCEHRGELVTVVVHDLGRWRTARPRGGGRGLEIIRSLVDDVTIASDDAGTIVTMTKRLSQQP
jgi:anti-sigma regulatory factor (Ser/Thr protein kinase)